MDVPLLSRSRRLVLAALCGLFPLAAPAQENKIETFLQQDMDFAAADLEQLAQGQILTRLIETDHKSEIAVLSAMKVQAGRDFFLRVYGESVPLIETLQVDAIGEFGTLPTLADVAAFALDERDRQVLRDCSPHDCDIKIAPWVLERIQREIDWDAPGHEARLDELVRGMVVEYVKGYRAGGNAVMGEYIDQKYVLSLATEFGQLLDASPYLFELDPNFYSYLLTFPEGAPANARDELFWTVEDIGANYPVSSVFHLSYVAPKDPSRAPVFAAKRIYSTHYFEASLGLTTIGGAAEDDEEAFYLVYLNRSRIDSLRRGGFLAGMLRGRLEDCLQKQLQGRMAETRQKLEESFEAQKTEVAKVPGG